MTGSKKTHKKSVINRIMESILGQVERITFHNSENGYTVAQIKQKSYSSLCCVVGCMPGIQLGERVRCWGDWKNHPVHGRQFEITRFEVEVPADVEGIRKYLGSGLIKGIGAAYAGRIVDRFGAETLKIIDKDPDSLLAIEGIGKKRIETIKNCWQSQRSIRDVMVFLQSYGVSPVFAQKIFKAWGDQSISKVKSNPFALARDIFGIGFRTADLLAQKMGMQPNAPERIDAGIEYVLSQLSQEGHVCYPVDDFLIQGQKILEVETDSIQNRLSSLQQQARIELKELIENGKKTLFIWHRPLFLAELGIARELSRLKKGRSPLRTIDMSKALDWVQRRLAIELAPNQKAAVAQAFAEKVLIITGGPGTGKSTITNAILAICQELTSRILLAAPTGRAAKRLSEITSQKAVTLHSLLEVDFKTGGFKKGKDNPLECDLIIIDEASMIDTFLMYHLLKALPTETRLIFVGDINQLPSVGPGNVLKDMIGSLSVPVATLTEIFRQAAGSCIILNAHRINKGIFPELYNKEKSDFFFIECEEGQEVLNTIVKLVSQRLPNRYGFDPFNDIQVLAPMKRGVIGTENLNQALQQILNPKQAALFRAGYKFQAGDKVMQIRNNYTKNVFNGDIGLIEEIDSDEQLVTIRFDEQRVAYEYSELDELALAYAVSVHKFQGSECPCVVMPVHLSHFMLLHRNLLYTGVTRGKKLVVLVGTKKALAVAVKKDDVSVRHTSLQQVLMERL